MNSTGIRIKGIAPYLFILPISIGVGIFGFACLIYVFNLSLTKTNLLTSQYVGFKNYYYVLFEEKWFLTALGHTLYFALWVVPLKLLFGLGLALAVSKRIKFGVFFRFTFLLPWVSATVIVALIFRYIFNPEWGIVNWFLGLFGIGKIMWTEHYSLAIPVIATMLAWQTMGFGMIIFLGAINSIPQKIFEAADLDGVNGLQRLRYITLPLLKPTIFFYTVICFIWSFRVFDAVYTFVEGGYHGESWWVLSTSPILVCSYFVYVVGFSMFAFGKASAMAILMFWLVLIVVVLQKRFIGSDTSALGWKRH